MNAAGLVQHLYLLVGYGYQQLSYKMTEALNFVVIKLQLSLLNYLYALLKALAMTQDSTTLH